MLHRHEWVCEVWQLTDLLKDMMLHEETIDDYDTRRRFAVFVDDLIDCVVSVNEKVGDLEEEASMCRMYMDDEVSTSESLRDELDYANQTIDDLRDTFRRIKNTVDQEST